jgi:hypothetical protein
MNQQLTAPKLFDREDKPRHTAMVADSNTRNGVKIAQEPTVIYGNSARWQ